MTTLPVVVFAVLAVTSAGHMWTVDPPSRASRYVPGDAAGAAGSCYAGICFWFNEGCTIGCPNCTGPGADLGPHGSCPGKQGKATLPDYARSYWYTLPDSTKKVVDCGINPWCAPGSSPVFNPCGVAGGAVKSGVPGAGGVPPFGQKQGDDQRELPELKGQKTVWKAGGVAEISWAIIANHGGGYQYRLCPKNSPQTEECFQKTPLDFYGDEQYIQWVPPPNGKLYRAYINPGDAGAPTTFSTPDPKNRTAIPLVKVNTGVVPEGSTWARNPIPGCRHVTGGAFGNDDVCDTDPSHYQFPPATKDLMRSGKLLGGFGAGACYGGSPTWFPQNCGGSKAILGPFDKMWEHELQFTIVDKIVVPKLPAGEYVMSARWDCEQTPQIWSMCSDITIAESDDVMV